MTQAEAPRRALSTDAATAGTLVLFGLVYAWLAVGEGVGSLSRPGAGCFPLLVAVVLVGSSAVVLVQELRAPADATRPAADPDDPPESDLADPVDWLRVVGVLAAALAVPLVGDRLGFVTTLSLAVVVMAKVMGMPGIVRPLALGAAFGVVTWLVFVYWLFVPLPAGVLGLA